MKIIWLSIVVICATLSAQASDVSPSLASGAQVFQERCVLCHGSAAMGEGILPLKIKDYPSTNLVSILENRNREQIKNAIIYGGTLGAISPYMPPMGNDLTWTQMESIIDFVMLMKVNREAALALLKTSVASNDANRREGQQLYESRCALCHGKYGEGDGRMAKVIKLPPPANLVMSRLPEPHLTEIISKGGAAVGRSPKMPPWGMQFTENEIKSIIIFIKSLRH